MANHREGRAKFGGHPVDPLSFLHLAGVLGEDAGIKLKIRSGGERTAAVATPDLFRP